MRRTILHERRPPECHDPQWVVCPWCGSRCGHGAAVEMAGGGIWACPDCGRNLSVEVVRSVVYVTRGVVGDGR